MIFNKKIGSKIFIKKEWICLNIMDLSLNGRILELITFKNKLIKYRKKIKMIIISEHNIYLN